MSDPTRAWLLRLAPDGEVPTPVSSPVKLAAATAALGSGPVGWALRTAHRVTEEVITLVPEHGGGPAQFTTLRRSVEAAVLVALRGVLEDWSAKPESVPPEVIEGDLEWARRGIPLDRVLRGVRIGHAHLHRILLDVVSREPEEIRIPESHRVSDLLFAYTDVQASRMAEEYIAERDRWQSGIEAARLQVVEHLLEGRPVESEQASRTLGYPLGRHHIAVIVDVGRPDAPTGRMHCFVDDLARAAGAQGALTAPAGHSALRAWLGWAAPPPADVAAKVRARLDDHPDLRVALGPAAQGAEGFRRTHLGAAEAARVARTGTGPGAGLSDYADLRLPALLTADPEHARWYADEVLGGLAGADGRTRELRETLRVYLACGRSLQAAGERLHVARNTVTYRVRRAEELLGGPVGDDPVELRVALEIARVLPAGSAGG